MAALPYMQFYVADYLADTMHLQTEEHGAYMLLIMNYWQTGKPLPKKHLRVLARVSEERWVELEETLSEFFQDDGTAWIHLRIESDLEKVNTAPRGKKLPNGESLSGFKGYVYFVVSPSIDRIKVGYSKNPWARLSELKRDYGDDCYVAATIKTVEKSEISVHKMLIAYHTEGEWFQANDEMKGLISAVKDKKVTTVDDIRSYVEDLAGLRSATTSTTNTDQIRSDQIRSELKDSRDAKKPKAGDPNSTKPSPTLSPAALSIAVKPPAGVTDEDWLLYLEARRDNRKNKPPMTQPALEKFVKGFLSAQEKTGLDSTVIIQAAAQTGWIGVRADYLENLKPKKFSGQQSTESDEDRFKRLARQMSSGDPFGSSTETKIIEGEVLQ